LVFPDAKGRNVEIQTGLIRVACEQAEDAVVATLDALIDDQNARHGDIFLEDRLEDCWDDQIGQFLLDKTKDATLRPDSLYKLLAFLLDHHYPGVRERLEELIPNPLPVDELGHERA